MRIITPAESLTVSGATPKNAVINLGMFLVGTVGGISLGPFLSPWFQDPNAGMVDSVKDYIVDYKYGEYGIHSIADLKATAATTIIGQITAIGLAGFIIFKRRCILRV